MIQFTNDILTKLDFNMPDNMRTLRVFDSFAGIGALHNALKFLGIPTEIIGLSETDIDATISYAAIHSTDLSVAGKQQGLTNADGTVTRSGLAKYGIELIKAKKPKYIMIENVKGLISKKFINDFYGIINEISSYGYRCYCPGDKDKKGEFKPVCLNAKNYGIPQNRERIFVICVREDVSDEISEFWRGKDFGFRLKDFLEDEVDEKYYLSDTIQRRFKFNGNCFPDNHNQRTGVIEQYISTNALEQCGVLDIRGNDCIKRVYRDNGICPTMTTMTGGSRQPKVLASNYKIRKLTPKECWRLMGFTDEQFDRAKTMGISDSQLYKQAGNSIVVNCLYYIFKELFKSYIK